ncbi:hypothetical protein [Streptomyces echinatus]|uniref:Uncharacterized protein n=1 Tax=Streptomyces echinatus TaxID=67293 RepID=A0A7W9PR80_9ACTN|nr:hypothetical protein [Streptomyces echinatus]MBB5926360.1 hypothetical protein [Streptomyces echinatus]
MHIAWDPGITCRPLVADHHRPGPHLRSGTSGKRCHRRQLLELHRDRGLSPAALHQRAVRPGELRLHRVGLRHPVAAACTGR